jgi:hypothetical protein
MAMDGHRFTAAAHAYDIYEHGGDWWLKDKLEHAAFIHTSTEMGRRGLIEHGIDAGKIVCIRRGLDRLPVMKSLRASRVPLQLVCVARLVEKKGLDHQLRIYAALQAADVPFAARIVGEGPLRPELEKLAGHLGIAAHLTFTGHLPQHEVWNQLAWADVLLHTGVIAPSGDRDGLPNVIPEAMSIGVLVITSPWPQPRRPLRMGLQDSPRRWMHPPTGLRRCVDSRVMMHSRKSFAAPRAPGSRRTSTLIKTPDACSRILSASSPLPRWPPARGPLPRVNRRLTIADPDEHGLKHSLGAIGG